MIHMIKNDESKSNFFRKIIKIRITVLNKHSQL